jgi:16S rRNA (cytosine1402-N4)-methyltransferase
VQKEHISVLLNEVIDSFSNLKDGGTAIDCTVGGGGHAEGLLLRYPSVLLVGLDRDEMALEIARERLKRFEDRVKLFKCNFIDLDGLLEEIEIPKVEAIFADLGLSSFQIEDEERGFSFKTDGPLDMRMGINEKSASDVVNSYGVDELERILREYSEERFARRIAKNIEFKRPIYTTDQLVKVIFSSLPDHAKKDWKKIVMRVFQGIRIEVNDELKNLNELLSISDLRLKSGGRIGVISFHSLEDRIVKRFFLGKNFVKMTKKPVIPSEEEIKLNPRSRSAKLRSAERV